MDEFTQLKREISETIVHLDILQKQSLNLFDRPEVHHRAMQLLAFLNELLHSYNHHFPSPTPEQNQSLQDLFFHSKEMQELTKQLKMDPHRLELQQKFKAALDDFHRDLNLLNNL